MTLAYRSDIDGLRGIAVLSVVLYHFGVRAFAGGYVGVDVFFVVSGFLITGIIFREIQQHTFSLAMFYERRVRRIFPALFATLALTLAAGAALFSAQNFELLGRSETAMTLFVSNVLFWSETGYFDAAAVNKPLLHTWSLSVEEQFYILYPLLLTIAWRRFGSRMVHWLALIAAASLALSAYLVLRQPDAAFYWAPTRGWELLLGGLIVCANPPAPSLRSRNTLAILGLATITASVFLFDADTPFPGLWAIPPTVGTALILYTGRDGSTMVTRLLTTRLLVGIGLISYSLYLLHWPLLVIAQHLAIVELSRVQKFGLLLLTVMLSAASWRWIEMPYRSRQHFTRRQVFVAGGFAMSLAGAAGLLVSAAHGFPQQFQTAAGPDRRACNLRLPGDVPAACRIGDPAARADFLLWGDSHARSFATALHESASRHSRGGYLAYAAGCPALTMEGPASRARFGPNSRECRQYNDQMFAYLERHRELTTIVLVARWSRYGDIGPDVAAFSPALKRTVARLSDMGRRVVIANQVPEVGYDVPEAYQAARATGRDLNGIIAPTREKYASSNRRVLAAFDDLQRQGVQLIDVRDRLCGPTSCSIMNAGQLLYSDDNHLSDYGAQYVSPLFDAILAEPVKNTASTIASR